MKHAQQRRHGPPGGFAETIRLDAAGPLTWEVYLPPEVEDLPDGGALCQETPEYKVWQESYYVDRRFYEAIAKNPPPRYRPPRPWQGHAGGGLSAAAVAGLALGGMIVLGRRPAAGAPPRASRPARDA